MVGPDEERHEAHEQHVAITIAAIAPQRLARGRGDHFGDDAESRQDQNVDLRVAEEPEEVLPEDRTAAAGDLASDLA